MYNCVSLKLNDDDETCGKKTSMSDVHVSCASESGLIAQNYGAI